MCSGPRVEATSRSRQERLHSLNPQCALGSLGVRNRNPCWVLLRLATGTWTGLLVVERRHLVTNACGCTSNSAPQPNPVGTLALISIGKRAAPQWWAANEGQKVRG